MKKKNHPQNLPKKLAEFTRKNHTFCGNLAEAQVGKKNLASH